MKCFKWIAFVFLIGVNIFVAVYLRDYFAVAKLPLIFIALSVCCSVLFALNVKSKALRGVTYGILIAVILLGLVYAMLYRRPLGFYAAASSTIAFARWFILGRKSSRHNLVTKITWVLDYLEYDEDFDTEYQYFDIRRTLDTRKGICFDYSHLFSAVCRSRGIPCYILDGYNRKDKSNLHTWNRAYFNGTWWNIDVSCDDRVEGRKYGFHEIDSFSAEDEDYHITFIY